LMAFGCVSSGVRRGRNLGTAFHIGTAYLSAS